MEMQHPGNPEHFAGHSRFWWFADRHQQTLREEKGKGKL